MNELERRALLGAAGLGAIAAMAKAGPLNPPAGAVAPTGRTTDEIYNKIPTGGAGDGRIAIPGGSGPITISNPGSYVLTGNVSGTGGDGIQIVGADNCTLDLNGYSVSSGTTNGTGIVVASGLKGITIRNGLVNGFSAGVAVNGTTIDVVIEDMFIRNAKLQGVSAVFANTRSLVIRRCTIADTGASTTAADPNLTIVGILCASSAAVIEGCVVTRLFYNGGGTGSLRGVQCNGGTNHIVRGCSVTVDSLPVVGGHIGIALIASSIYKDNVVAGFTTKYNGGTDGGGNA